MSCRWAEDCSALCNGLLCPSCIPAKKKRSEAKGIPRPKEDDEGKTLCYHDDGDEIDIGTFVPSNKTYLSGDHYEKHKSMLPEACIKCGEAYPR